MKPKFFLLLLYMLLFVFSCSKKNENPWNIELKHPVEKVEITDISKSFYDQDYPLQSFKQEYPWFQGTVSDEDFVKRRKDSTEIAIYKEAAGKINQKKLSTDLANLFAHIKYYFPKFKNPKVFLYSSGLQGIDIPVFYQREENFLFIDLSAFLGDGNHFYNGLERYLQKSMNPQNIIPKVAFVMAEQTVPMETQHQKFLNLLIYEGKLMLLQDAFLPDTPDYLKINYTKEQYQWAKANEQNIWNFFVEKDLVFSDDTLLYNRFIAPGPFSKFYTEVDNESSPQLGVFIGWQICKKFYKIKPQIPIKKFLRMNAKDIFNTSEYRAEQND